MVDMGIGTAAGAVGSRRGAGVRASGGGHVGFYVGEDATAYHVLGGNQGDTVSVARIAKDRCIARRWPSGRPVIGKPVQMAARKPISTDEA
ncbi:hypothetical protein QP150_09490 [Sphingomonas sp. 22L2VL55-3]